MTRPKAFQVKQAVIPSETIGERIFFLRGKRVMFDRDLAALYGVTTGNLNKAVKRNIERFPEDFMFTLTREEYTVLRFHFGSLKRGTHPKYLPSVFTEQGIAMLSGVLKSKRAVRVNIAIMRAFVQLREALSTHKELASQFRELERRVGKHDGDIQAIFRAIQRLMAGPEKPKGRIGFHP
ncbi:MAG: ORF6N domain-containing protein [Candidatus Omnitrophica bacterium]|nr:ORF6N domain-containing protein [Candidatus Omnitrophota bacterium]